MRGLSPAFAPPPAAVAAAFDRRLDPHATAPLAVGVSGGGDSLALLILTLDWARAHGRRVLALTVDHRLQPGSEAWTDAAVAAARRLGAETRALAWDGSRPRTGLPAAARDARHRLLADAAREAGAQALLLGHTADDLTEAAIMRAAGSSVGDPREWSPSPVWPQGRGVFLLRPLLGATRADLRAFLRARGETWFDDPANDDLRYARARARSASAPSVTALRAAAPPPLRQEEEMSGFPCSPVCGGGGPAKLVDGALLSLPRASLTPALLAAACLCAAGHDRPPRRREVEALAARLAGPGPLAATLAGARIAADHDTVRFAREIGRRGLPTVSLAPGAPTVWDGRFEIVAARPGLTVRALAGLAARLPAAERAALGEIPAFARPALPVIVDGDGAATCPILAGRAEARVVPLVLARLAAACGLVTREGEGGDQARGETRRGVLSWTGVV